MSAWTIFFGGGGVGFGGELPSQWVDDVDTFLPNVPNAVGGSVHTATSPVSIGGAGIVAPGALYASGATLIIPAYANWATNTAYSGGVYVVANGHIYYCLIGGTSASTGSGPSATTTAPILDGPGALVWSYVSPAPLAGYGLIVASGAKSLIDRSAELDILGTLAVGNLGNLNILSGGTATVESGGTLYVVAGGLINLTGANGLNVAELQLNAYGLLQVNTNGSIVVTPGGLLQVSSGGSFNLFGTQTIESGGAIDVDNGGLIEVLSGGEIKVDSGGEILVQSGGTLQANGGSTVTLAGTNTFSGTNTLSGPTTQTSSFTRSGSAATTFLRVTTLAMATDTTLANPEDYDLVLIAPGPGTGQSKTLTLGTPPGGLANVVVRIAMVGSGSSAGGVIVANGAPIHVIEMNPGQGPIGNMNAPPWAPFVDVSPVGGSWCSVGGSI